MQDVTTQRAVLEPSYLLLCLSSLLDFIRTHMGRGVAFALMLFPCCFYLVSK